jgi:CHASE2 domain-containing sensor protein
MAESPRRLELRLTISGAAPYRDIAVELAMKFAQFAGASQRSVSDLSKAVSTALVQTTAGSSIDIELTAEGTELIVTTNAGSSTERATFPLPD